MCVVELSAGMCCVMYSVTFARSSVLRISHDIPWRARMASMLPDRDLFCYPRCLLVFVA